MDLPKKEIPLTIDEKGILDDEFDYEIKNPPERHTRSKGEYSRREDTQDRGPDLDAIVTEASREEGGRAFPPVRDAGYLQYQPRC